VSPILEVFKTFSYRITIALIYIFSGLYVALFGDESASEFKIIGWMIFGFGVYRTYLAIKYRLRSSK